MSATTTVDLREARSWDPFELLPSPSFAITRGTETVNLLDLVNTVSPAPITDAPGLVVRSGDIDETGRIIDGTKKAPYRGFRADPQSDDNASSLRLGDVLVPAHPQTPAILVTEWLDPSIVFSPSFAAFRPIHINPLILWAALSSQTGMKARAEAVAYRTPSNGIRLWSFFSIDRSLLRATTPLLDRLREWLPDPMIELRDSAPPVSTWSFRNLQVFRTWEHAIRGVGRKDPEGGIPLSELADITRGRSQPSTRRRVDRDIVESEGIPIEEVLLMPGDLVIENRIVRSLRINIVDAVRPATPHEFRIRAGEPELTARIAQYLTSEAGKARLRERYFGSHIPRLSMTELRSLTIPQQALEVPLEGAAPTLILGQALEDALWTT